MWIKAESGQGINLAHAKTLTIKRNIHRDTPLFQIVAMVDAGRSEAVLIDNLPEEEAQKQLEEILKRLQAITLPVLPADSI